MRSILPTLFVLSSLLTTSFSHPTFHPSWRPLAPLPLPRREHTIVFLAPSTICVLGGIIPTNDTSPLLITTTSLVPLFHTG